MVLPISCNHILHEDHLGNSISYLWEQNPNRRDDPGNALSVCIRAFCKSGYDARHEVLWKVPRERKIYRLELNLGRHQWLCLLKDSEDSMTMAVLVEDRLATHSSEPCGRVDVSTTSGEGEKTEMQRSASTAQC
jgi:hypothetical protein